MFGKKREKKDEKKKGAYDVSYENLAVPEVHTEPEEKEDHEDDNGESITYDSVAIPEIHIRRKK